MLEESVWVAIHIGYWALMLLAAASVGHLPLRKMRFHSGAERVVFTLALGLGLWALALFVLGLARGFYPVVIFWLTIAAAAAAGVQLVRSQKGKWRALVSSAVERLARTPLPVALLSILLLAYWAGLLVLTLYPPLQWDATSNHLVLASRYLVEHRILPVTGVVQPVLPALNHMLFAWGLALKDDILSQMMVHSMLMLVAGGLYTWGKREGSAMLGLAAGCVWLGHPIVIHFGRSAYTDIGVSCFVFLGLYALRVFWIERSAGWWYLSISLLAMAGGAKLSGLFFAGLACAFGLIALARDFVTRIRRSRTTVSVSSPDPMPPRVAWKTVLSGWALALCITAPWYGFIARETGNPIWPVPAPGLNAKASPEYQVDRGSFDYVGRPRTLGSFLRLPFDWRYHWELFHSEAPLPLLSLILAWPLSWVAAIWSRRVRWWAAWSVAFTIFWFMGPQQLRYWLPALPLAGLAICESINWLVERRRIPVVVRYAIWTCLILFAFARGGKRVVEGIQFEGMPPANSIAREDFLTKFYAGYTGAKYVNQYARPDEVICVYGGSWLNYYFRPEVIDLISPMYADRRPTFVPGRDEKWTHFLEQKKVNWIFIDHAEPQGMFVPKEHMIEDSFWADYQLVYADSAVWVFRRKPVS